MMDHLMRPSSHTQSAVASNNFMTMQLLRFHRSGQHTENELMEALAQKGGEQKLHILPLSVFSTGLNTGPHMC